MQMGFCPFVSDVVFLDDDSADASSFGIPSHVITDLELF
jgi:hypothetical protein